MQDRGADPAYSTRSGMEILFRKNPVFFPAEKSVIFLCGKITYFSVWKNQGFLLAVLYWTVDSERDSGQRDTGQLDSGQRTDGLSNTGQRDTGRAILYWTGAVRDSWTVDGTEWTEVLSLL